MLAFTQLTLVRNKLREISESPYFSKDMHEYLAVLQEAVDKLYENHVNVADKIIADCTFLSPMQLIFSLAVLQRKFPTRLFIA